MAAHLNILKKSLSQLVPVPAQFLGRLTMDQLTSLHLTAGMNVSNNTTTEPDYENTATTSALSLSINYNPTIRAADNRHFAMAGQNALFKFNGVDIIREENEVEDLIAGIKLTLNDTTSGNITIGTSYDADKALTDIQGFCC